MIIHLMTWLFVHVMPWFFFLVYFPFSLKKDHLIEYHVICKSGETSSSKGSLRCLRHFMGRVVEYTPLNILYSVDHVFCLFPKYIPLLQPAIQ